jgi:hypothetical protein
VGQGGLPGTHPRCKCSPGACSPPTEDDAPRLAGGTLLTISGKGFPDSSQPGALAAISITLPTGAACAPQASNYTTITCLTAPPTASAPAAAAQGLPFRGWYPGTRGIQYEFFNRTAAPSQLAAVLGWSLEAVGNGSFSSVLQGSFESPMLDQLPHCTRSRAFFSAPRHGDYSFLMSADDWGFLNGTYHNVRPSCWPAFGASGCVSWRAPRGGVPASCCLPPPTCRRARRW